MVQFSDSIFIFSRDSSVECGIAIKQAGLSLFIAAMKNGILLRGAWAKGPCTVDIKRSLFFGQALVDSFLLAENQMWFGAVEHRSVGGIGQNTSTHLMQVTTKYLVPLKSGSEVLEALNWPAWMNEKLVRRLVFMRDIEEHRAHGYRENTMVFAQRQWSRTKGGESGREDYSMGL